jgi:hypothetical protein
VRTRTPTTPPGMCVHAHVVNALLGDERWGNPWLPDVMRTRRLTSVNAQRGMWLLCTGVTAGRPPGASRSTTFSGSVTGARRSPMLSAPACAIALDPMASEEALSHRRLKHAHLDQRRGLPVAQHMLTMRDFPSDRSIKP